jgi:hypothetical protein
VAYVSVSDVRNEGLTDTTKYPDPRVEQLITIWSAYVDRACRQWFEARTLDARLDGNDSDTLFLPVPVIELTALYLNGDFSSPADPSRYFVYNGRSLPDDRQNPRVKLLSQDYRDIFRSRVYGQKFVRGKQNQRLVGSFGFVEQDGSTPELIKRAVIKLVISNAPTVAEKQGESGPVAFEMTDGHSIQYVTAEKLGFKSSGFAVTKDAEVDQILSMYRAPIGMAVTGSSVVTFGGFMR